MNYNLNHSTSLMLAATTNEQRQNLLHQLERDTIEVHANITELINERKRIYEKTISEKRAKFNEQINNQGADENEYDIIREGKNLLGFGQTDF